MPRTATLRRAAGLAGWVAVLAVGLLLWPATFGGRTSYILVSGTSMEPTMHTGDLAILRAKPTYAPGDIVAYRIPADSPGAGFLVIHRVIGGSSDEGYLLQGDNRTLRDVWRPDDGDVLGARVALVPAAGKAVGRLSSPLRVAAFLGALTVALVVLPTPGKIGPRPASGGQRAPGVGRFDRA